MASNSQIKSVETLKTSIQNEEQSLKYDTERHLYAFECELDTLSIISDGLPDDRKVTNALNGLHDRLSKIYADFRAQLPS